VKFNSYGVQPRVQQYVIHVFPGTPLTYEVMKGKQVAVARRQAEDGEEESTLVARVRKLIAEELTS
jgi:hypothetical protein